MRFRPCIDLHNGRVKQIVGSTLNSCNSVVENFISSNNAAYYAQLYKTSGLTGGHIIKLGPGNDEEALAALEAYPGGLQLGGGVTRENATSFLEAGASHVIVTSYVFSAGAINWLNLESLEAEVGRERLVLDLSCRKKDGGYFVVTDKWQNFTEFQITESNLKMLAGHCDEFLVHAADVEGKCDGIEQDLVSMLADWTEIPVTYAGGVSSFDDLETIRRTGHGMVDVTVGSALDIFGGYMPYDDVVAFCSG